MTPESILWNALEKKTPAEREAYLAEACGADAALRREIDALIAAHAEAGGFLNVPEARTGTYIRGPQGTNGAAEGVGKSVGKYKLLQMLGEGGMGAVYLAEQTEPVRRKVALKLIKAGMDTRAVLARFEAERQALALMDHPNIAKVLDAGTSADGKPYFVMELVKGIPITAYCDEAKLSIQERLELFVPVCHALQHAHQKGIIHRDLKPTNVIVALYDGKPVPKVIDFGVAKALHSNLTERTLFTEVGSVIGTLEYMSPEQAELNNLDIDTRTDIYSLGSILYEILTGFRPLDGRRLRTAAFTEMLRIIREEDPPKPSTKLSTSGEKLPAISAQRKLEPKRLSKLLSGDLDWIVMKALAKERNRRYESASALAADLERFRNNEPVLAGPPSAGYRLRKFVQRNRVAVSVGLAILGVIALSGVALTLALIHAVDSQRFANEAKEDALQSARQAIADRKDKDQALKTVEKERDQKDQALQRSDGLRLAAEATLVRTSNPGLSLLLGLEAVKRHPHPLTYDAVFGAAAECREVRAVPIRSHSPKRLLFSSDGQRLITLGRGYDDRSSSKAVVWDAATGKALAEWNGYYPEIHDMDWSPDGRTVAVATAGEITFRYNDGLQPPQLTFTSRVVYVWDAATGRELHHLKGHTQEVTAVRFSHDGQKLLTTGSDQTARLWDLRSGSLLRTIPGVKAYQQPAQFSSDSKQVLVVRSGRLTMGPNPNEVPEERPHTDLGITNRVGRMTQASSSGGGMTYSRIGNPIAALYDAESGRPVATFSRKTFPLADLMVPHSDETGQAVQASNGSLLAISVAPRYLGIWDARQGGTERKLLQPPSQVVAMVFSPDCSQLATALGSGAVLLWDVETGNIKQRLDSQPGQVQKLKFSRDGHKLLAERLDDAVQVWNLRHPGKETIMLRGSVNLAGAEFIQDAKMVVTADSVALRYWTLEPLAPLARELPTKAPPRPRGLSSLFGSQMTFTYSISGRPVPVTFSPDGQRLFVGTADMQAALWDLETGRHLATAPFPMNGMVFQARFAPAGDAIDLATDFMGYSYDKDLSRQSPLVRWKPGAQKPEQFLDATAGGIRYFCFAPDESKVLVVSNGRTRELQSDRLVGWKYTGDRENEVSVWDAKTGKRLCVIPHRIYRDMEPCFSRDSTRVLVAPENETWIGWFDAATGQLVSKLESKGDGFSQYRFVSLTPDGKTVIAGRMYYNAGFHFWDATTKAHLGELKVENGRPDGGLISPNSKLLAAISDRVIVLVDVRTRQVVHRLTGHTAEIHALEFSADSRYLVSGSADHSAILWNTQTGAVVHVYKGHPGAVTAVAYSPRGTHVVTQSSDQKIRIWPVDLLPSFMGRLHREWTYTERLRYEVPGPTPATGKSELESQPVNRQVGLETTETVTTVTPVSTSKK